MKKQTQKILATDLTRFYNIVCDSWQKKITEYLLEFAGQKYIEVENSVIVEAYLKADTNVKKLLEKYFTIEREKDLFEFDTYAKVCKGLKEKELQLKDFYSKKSWVQAKIQQLEKFFNQGWKPNWKDKSEHKWYPYFSIGDSGELVFSGSNFFCVYFYGFAGFYKDEKTANFIGRNVEFRKIYADLM